MSKCQNLKIFIMHLFLSTAWNKENRVGARSLFYKTLSVCTCTGSCTICSFDSVSPKARSKSNLLFSEYYASMSEQDVFCAQRKLNFQHILTFAVSSCSLSSFTFYHLGHFGQEQLSMSLVADTAIVGAKNIKLFTRIWCINFTVSYSLIRHYYYQN